MKKHQSKQIHLYPESWPLPYKQKNTDNTGGKDTVKYLANGDPDVSLNWTDTPVYTAMH